MYSKTTHAIEVSVEPAYLNEQSSPAANHFVWSYTVTIRNLGTSVVKLTHRHWKIVNATGAMQQVDGEGVVGVEPVLKAGESFEYSSGTHLTTPSGIMMGTYDFSYLTQEGEPSRTFSVEIPAFSLDTPNNVIAFN